MWLLYLVYIRNIHIQDVPEFMEQILRVEPAYKGKSFLRKNMGVKYSWIWCQLPNSLYNTLLTSANDNYEMVGNFWLFAAIQTLKTFWDENHCETVNRLQKYKCSPLFGGVSAADCSIYSRIQLFLYTWATVQVCTMKCGTPCICLI